MAENKEEGNHLHCPYCDEEIRNLNLPWCQACHIQIFYCPSCRAPVSRESTVCTYCGAEITGAEE